MTAFFIDISHYQAPGLNLHGDHLHKQGYVAVAIKASEGASYIDPAFRSYLDQARRDSLDHVAYHFLGHGNIDAQADNCARAVGDPTVRIMIDCEAYGATLADARAFRTAMKKRGYRVTLLYLPHWYWERIGSPALRGWRIVASAYPRTLHAYASTLYPGDKASGWAPYGGVTPFAWQFASTGRVDGYDGNVDVDAFRGSVAELRKSGVFTPAKPAPAHHAPKPTPAPTPVPAREQAARNIEHGKPLAKVKRRRVRHLMKRAAAWLRGK